MERNFTFNITIERHKKVKKHIKNPDTIATFINKSIDQRIKMLETKYLSDFIYYLGFPTLMFLGMVSLSLVFPNWLFYVLTVIIGIYIVILFYLFYNKYRGVKYGDNDK